MYDTVVCTISFHAYALLFVYCFVYLLWFPLCLVFVRKAAAFILIHSIVARRSVRGNVGQFPYIDAAHVVLSLLDEA